MTALTLYAVASEYRQAADMLAELDLDDQTVTDTLESISGDLTTKSQNTAFVIKNIEATVEQINVAVEAMNARAQKLEKRAERIREHLLQNMLMAGVQKIDSPYFKLSVRDNPPKVIVDDEKQIPIAYMTDPAPPPPPPSKPDKVLIKRAITEGFDVPGCRIERGRRLEIR